MDNQNGHYEKHLEESVKRATEYRDKLEKHKDVLVSRCNDLTQVIFVARHNLASVPAHHWYCLVRCNFDYFKTSVIWSLKRKNVNFYAWPSACPSEEDIFIEAITESGFMETCCTPLCKSIEVLGPIKAANFIENILQIINRQNVLSSEDWDGLNPNQPETFDVLKDVAHKKSQDDG